MIQGTLLIVGLVLFATALVRAFARWKRVGWLETQAEVLYSDIRPASESKRPGYVGVCILTYQRAEQKFVGQFHFAKGTDYAAVRTASKRYSAGSRQNILVRPDDPQKVMLQSVNTTDTRLAVACAVLGGICTVAAFTWFRNA